MRWADLLALISFVSDTYFSAVTVALLRASLITTAPSFMAIPVDVVYTGLPANLEVSTFVSAAMMTMSACAMSSSVSWFSTPEEPMVSTFISCPSF